MRRRLIQIFVALCLVEVISADVIYEELELNVSHGEFPWMVALMNTKNNENNFFCAGTLVSSRHVVTGNKKLWFLISNIFIVFYLAAHCISEKNSDVKRKAQEIVAIFGAHNLVDGLELERTRLTPVEIILHSDWNPTSVKYEGDVAILVFEEGKIKFSDFVEPTPLLDATKTLSVTEGTIVGWGKATESFKTHENVLKLSKSPIEMNEDCFLGIPSLESFSSGQTFCASIQSVNGFYFGKSASQFFFKIGRKYYLKGFVSTSVIDGDKERTMYAVYTDILKYKQWIDDNTKVAATTVPPTEPPGT